MLVEFENYQGNKDVNDGLKYITQEQFLESKVSLAYAITAHKSQGSQYDSIIIVLDSVKLADNAWIYTAITRAKKSCYIIGDQMLLNKAITASSVASNRQIGVSYDKH